MQETVLWKKVSSNRAMFYVRVVVHVAEFSFMFIFPYSISTVSAAYEWTIYTNWTSQFGAR